MLDKLKDLLNNLSDCDWKAITYWFVLVVYLIIAIIGLTKNIKPLFWGGSAFVYGLVLGELLSYLE